MQQTITGRVNEKVWGPDDSYLTVEVQVDSSIFKSNQTVKVTVEEI